jgi:hypothetical protein
LCRARRLASWRTIGAVNTMGAVADRDPEFDEARAEYLRNREAVAAAAKTSVRWSPWRVATLAVAAIAAGLFVATVVSYYRYPQEEGPTNTDLPIAVSVAALAICWLVILPFILEARTVGRRVRNIIIAAVATAILLPLLIPLFVELGSLVADLAYAIGH